MASDDDARLQFLVVASLDADTPARPVRMLLARLFRGLSLKGSYSITLSRQQGFAILCGFELKDDADRVAAAVGAKPIGKYGGWKSQRAFQLNERAHQRIAAALNKESPTRSTNKPR